MGEIILSILIPTVVGREVELNNLLTNIARQTNWMSVTDRTKLQVCIAKDNKELVLGKKREQLYKSARGKYSWMIDDDDDIAPNAIEKILAAIDHNPDCITFEERCDMNGEIKRSNHSILYEKWQDNFDGFDYVRTPFYKDVIKTSIAQSVPFPHIRYNEDEQWSMALLPHLENEFHINEQLYLYSYYPKETHEERYGLDK